MSDPQPTPEVKIIVVPKALEEFFAHRLQERYAGRDDVRVIVDRRHGERRSGKGARPDIDRRTTERRVMAGWWSLPDMPFQTH